MLLERFLPTLQWVYFARFPLLLALGLVSIAPLFIWLKPGIFKSLLVLETGREVFAVSWLAIQTAWAAMVTTRLVLVYAPDRFGLGPWKAFPKLTWVRVFLWSLLALPILIGVLGLSTPSPYVKGLCVVLGGMAALGILFLSMLLLALLNLPGSDPPDLILPSNHRVFQWALGIDVTSKLRGKVMPWLAKVIPEGLGSGYIDYRISRLFSGHVAATGFFVLTLAVYFWGYSFGYEILSSERPGVGMWVPALAYVLVLLMLLGWGVSGVAFFLDRYRVPTLLPLILLSALFYWFSKSDHYYQLLDGKPLTPGGNTAQGEAVDVVQAGLRRHRSRDRPVLVVVAASGGGIQAAAWTARVLTGLEEQCGPAFGRSVRLISAVSGGSVGAMYFVDAYTQDGLPSDHGALEKIFELAGRSSLNEAAWGIAYPDLWRAVWPYFWKNTIMDRAWAMEQAWKRGFPGSRAKLSDWRPGVAAGWRPATAFNATVVETGERFLLASFDVPEHWAAKSFYRLYRQKDVSLVTAVRLSATFPYVTPIARALSDEPEYHIADGGYYDNFGVMTVVEWLNTVLPAYKQELPAGKVLLVQIRSAPFRKPPPLKEGRGWLYQAVGPVVTLSNVRTAAQIARNDLEINLLREAWRHQGVKIESVEFFFEDPNAPLSWKLTDEQQEAIGRVWRNQGDGLRKVEELFRNARG